MIRRRHSKRNKALRKAIAKVIKWALITLYGGEVMFLGMPLYWAAVESIIKDIC